MTTTANLVPTQSVGSARVLRKPGKRDWTKVALWVTLLVTAVIWAVPFVFMFLTSAKSKADIAQTSTWSFPSVWMWSNYGQAVETGNLWVTGTNSLIVALIKVPLGLFLAALAAYALARIKPVGAKMLVSAFAIGSMVPIQIGLGPLFQIMLKLNLLDTKPGLILPYLAFGVPYSVFMLYGVFKGIPEEIEESARIDGCSTFRIFWQICIPLVKPALAALFVLDFVATWNEYAMATTLLQSQDQWTIPLAVQSFNTQHATDYGPMNAFIFMSAVPVLVVYLMFQRYFVSGAFSGAVKG
jgi:raffinose/stachyose/melibiose transport system permease protein